MNCIKDNRTFWENAQVIFTNKNGNNTKQIILVEKDDTISDNSKVADINNYFVNITEDINIPEIKKNTDIDLNTGTVCVDHIEKNILNYSEHPSIITI